jgi:hypothetical protein
MMSITDEIVTQVNILPESAAREVLNFIEFLKFKTQFEKRSTISQDLWSSKLPEAATPEKPGVGLSKAFELLVSLSDDFMADGRQELPLEKRQCH